MAKAKNTSETKLTRLERLQAELAAEQEKQASKNQVKISQLQDSERSLQSRIAVLNGKLDSVQAELASLGVEPSDELELPIADESVLAEGE